METPQKLTLQPIHTEFMDDEMKKLWETMDPKDLREFTLMGGTALAMYLNHRYSEDFDFFSKKPLDLIQIKQWKWIQNAEYKGGSRMIDIQVIRPERTITINLVQYGILSKDEPHKTPDHSANGIKIAHPTDILTGKISAITQRKAIRDYMDIASAHRLIPEQLREAINYCLSNPMSIAQTPQDLARHINIMPWEIEYELDKTSRKEIEKLVQKLTENPELFKQKETPDRKSNDYKLE